MKRTWSQLVREVAQLRERVSKIERFKGWRVRYVYNDGEPESRVTDLYLSRCEIDEWIADWSQVWKVSEIRIMRCYRKEKR